MTGKSLPRRTVLQGLGTTLALPFLEAMLPRLRAAAKPAHRFQAFYVPNGMAMEYWTPKGEGAALELSPILEPLAAYREQMLVFSGIKASWNYIHAGASGSFLTGTPRGGHNEIEIIADVSIDQLLGRHFAQETQLASLEMSLDQPANAGACTGNLSCAYLDTLCWANPTQPLPMEWNPRAVFEKLFGDSGSTDRAAREKRLAQRASILDSVTGKLADLQRELGPRDQSKVAEYTDAVRDVERRIQMAERQSSLELPELEKPLGAPPVFEDYLALMLDLQVLALQSDLTRVVTFMIAKEQSPRPYPQIGVPEAHHPLSHHNNIPELVEKMSKINRYHAELFAKYLARLRWLAAGSHDHPLRRGHLQQQRALGRQPASDAGGRRGREAQGRAASAVRQQAFASQPAADLDGQAGVPGGEGRRQHRQAPHRHAAGRLIRLQERSMRTLATRLRLIPLGLAFCCAASLVGAGQVHPPVLDAVKRGDLYALRSLLEQKADVNAADPDGSTALDWASYHDDLETAGLLLRAGAKVNAATDLGATPLWMASENGSMAMVRRLLEAGANPNAALQSGETPAMVAARGGYPQVLELLLAKGANPNAHGTRGQTALMWAVAQKHPEVVKVLLAHGADLQRRSDVWSEVMAVPPHGYLPYNKAIPHGGETALLFAARAGDLDSARLLVAAGAHVNDADAWGVSAVTLAAHSGFGDLVRFLLDQHADPNAAPAGFTALQEAVMRRDAEMVAALLDHGADPNTPLKTWTPTRRSSDDWNFEPSLVGATPFWLAARFTEPDVLRLLLKHGADPLFVHHADYVAEQGFGAAPRKETATALMAATGMIRVKPWVEADRKEQEAVTLETVKMLVDLGVDLNTANTDGRTALDAARTLRYASVVSYLQEKGAKAGTGAAAPRRGRAR